MEEWKEIAHLLAERIACGCQQPDPCWTCQQALKRFNAKRNDDHRIQEIHRHPPDPADR